MLRKSVILGVVLLLAGGAVLAWGLSDKRKERQQAACYRRKHASEMAEYLKQYNEWLRADPKSRSELPWGLDKYGKAKSRAELSQERQERLLADLERLAAGSKDVYPFAEILYGPNWRQEVDKYKKRKETRELIVTSSILSVVAGGAVLGWWLLLGLGQGIISLSSNFKKLLVRLLGRLRKLRANRLVEAGQTKETADLEQVRGLTECESCAGVSQDVVEHGSGWSGSGGSGKRAGTAASVLEDKKIAVLLSDRESVEYEERLGTEPEGSKSDQTEHTHPDRSVRVATLSDSCEDSVGLEDSVKAQTESMEKQIAEFKRMTETVQQTAIEHSEPLNEKLRELTEQVAAIREYASAQQDRVEKLQDGYDWNIIRNFCLRIIRCIDNLEERMRQFSEQDVETGQMEEVRDELIFALESSGVERFEPQINSDYRGQEKRAEVVKEKEYSEKGKMTGKIAEVIRPGYQYVINEDNVKVVRTAQVKLYG
ncbi:MAG: nucleotide exchange factor GrpE [Planctomycetota bacterium]|jgi:molecular chaperone GrpE (heat shock protein)